MPGKRPSLTYVVAAGDYVKIGSAIRPLDRLRFLQTGCPYPFELLAVTERVAETDAHQKWEPLRLRSEWFARTDALEVWAFGVDDTAPLARYWPDVGQARRAFPVLREPLHVGYLRGERPTPCAPALSGGAR